MYPRKGSFSTRHDRSVKIALIDLPIRMKGKSKRTRGNSLNSLGGQNKYLSPASQTLLTEAKLLSATQTIFWGPYKADVIRDNSQRRFLAQHSVAMVEQCCKHSKQCRNNVVMLGCAKNRRCESSRVISP